MNTIVLKILIMVAERILSLIKPQEIKNGVENLILRFETTVRESESTVDDRIILPVLRVLRAAFCETETRS